MQRLKLLVSLLFILFAFVFFGQRWFTTAAGRNTVTAAAPLAPLGVSASDGDYADKVGVMWNTVRGAALYRVFRSASNDSSSAAEVGTTAANYFFDSTATPNQTYFYWVRAENAGATSNLSVSAQGLRAIGQFQSGFFSPLSPPPVPAGNPVTAAKASLGKTLFWDEQLSSTLTVSCGTCHRPATGGSDPRTVINNARARNPGFDNVFNTLDDVFGSPGVPLNNADGTYSASNAYGFGEQVTARKSPSYINLGFAFAGLFWDGRASNTFRDPLTNQVLLTEWASLESQILSPPISDGEMGHGNRNWTEVAAQITQSKPLALASDVPQSLATWINGRTYLQLFEEVYGSPEVTPARIAMAIATHERTLFSDRTPLDRWGANIEALTAQEDRGREIYIEANCSSCHGGPLLSDQNFHNIGVRPANEDRGREMTTGRAEDRGRFKTPTLRNIELRQPYMHNGRFQTLEEVVEFYNRGGDFDAPNVDDTIRPLNLSPQQKADLVTFLKRPLTDLRVKNELPPFDRPKLYTESNRVPQIIGSGRAGTGGAIPQVTAIEPPLSGNPSFTVGVSGGVGGAQAVLVVDANDPGIAASIPSNGSLWRVSINLTSGGFGSVSLLIPSDPTLIGQTFYGRWYVEDANAANGFSVSPAFRFTIFGNSPSSISPARFDFDGDGRTDISTFRPSNNVWYRLNSGSSNAFAADQFGATGDRLAPADFDGDGRTDMAVFRPTSGAWYLQRSLQGFATAEFGLAEDLPVPADYDGDGRADIAVFRPSSGVWYILRSRDNQVTTTQFGLAEDVPVVADYDADGKADIAVWRPETGVWYLLRSRDGFAAAEWGISEDKPVVGDYDGDGKADLAVWRPSSKVWYLLKSRDGFAAGEFGAAGDVPTPGDYDGDGKTDLAVWRPSTSVWYLQQSTAGVATAEFGLPADKPVPAAFVR